MHTKNVSEEIITYYFWKDCQCNTFFPKAKTNDAVLLFQKKKTKKKKEEDHFFYSSYLKL